MIRTDAWQKQVLEELQTVLLTNEHVLALALFGSASSYRKADPSSDLDILVIVQEDFFPGSFQIQNGSNHLAKSMLFSDLKTNSMERSGYASSISGGLTF